METRTSELLRTDPWSLHVCPSCRKPYLADPRVSVLKSLRQLSTSACCETMAGSAAAILDQLPPP